MNRKEVASMGGTIWGRIQRDRALKNYYENPKICKCCGNIIKVRGNEKIPLTKKKIFCDRSCSVKFNNTLRQKKLKGNCKKCGCEISYKKKKSGGYYKRKYCEKCKILAQLETINLTGLNNRTKGELFKSNKNWQSARSSLRRHAQKVFLKSGKKYECKKCGYNIHVEVAHKRPVSDFPNESLIKEINDINNLIGLCRNHHWEFENGYLFLSDIRK
jgi:hypothetical protein